jgi:hypothetical protein
MESTGWGESSDPISNRCVDSSSLTEDGRRRTNGASSVGCTPLTMRKARLNSSITTQGSPTQHPRPRRRPGRQAVSKGAIRWGRTLRYAVPCRYASLHCYSGCCGAGLRSTLRCNTTQRNLNPLRADTAAQSFWSTRTSSHTARTPPIPYISRSDQLKVLPRTI